MSAWVLVRNPDWWGWRDHPGNVDRVEWTHMPNGERRLEALLSGEIDFLPDPPIDGLERIRRTPGLKLAETWLPRVVYLGLNQGSEELHTSDVKGKNPFKDKRVRQALYQAIDVDAIRDKALRGLGVPTSMLVTPAVAGYIEELDRLPYDPARAKALLDEAGYADGFAVRLDCPQSRFEGPAVCSEIAQQLGKIGVRVSIDLLSEDARYERLYQRTSDLYLQSHYSGSLDSLEILREYHSRPSKLGATGYANPQLDELIEKIESALITYGRDALFEQAWQIMRDDVVVIPFFRPSAVWAMREELDLPIGPDLMPYFYDAQLK